MEAVTVMALVKAGKSKKVGSFVTGSDGAFGGMADGGRIVVKDGDGSSKGVNRLGKDILVRNHTSELEVTHSEIAKKRILGSDESALDMKRKRSTPKERWEIINKPNTPHARLGSINGANTRWEIGDNFRKLGGAKVEVSGQGFKVVELSTDMGIKANTVVVGMADPRLQSAKQTTATGDGQDHAAEFA
jgi:hypothetical protein